jgi:hypothetical protein
MAKKLSCLAIILFLLAGCSLFGKRSKCADCDGSMMPLDEVIEMNFRAIEVSLNSFRENCSRFPTEEEHLRILLEPQFCGKPGERLNETAEVEVATDPFKQPWIYKSSKNSFQLGTLGQDKKPGGFGWDKDIWISGSIPTVSK